MKTGAAPRRQATPLWERSAGIAAGLVAVGAIGVLDWYAPEGLTFTLLYLVPIVAAGWWLGRAEAVALGVTAAGLWMLHDALPRMPSEHWMTLWNGLTRVVVYAGSGALIATLRAERQRLFELNETLERALDREAGLARTDALTGLPNSRAFLETLETEIARRQRDGEAICLAYLDLDDFKKVNDRHGHGAGDRLLADVAAALGESLRAGDVAARLGGDEFAVLLHAVEADEARDICERLVRRIAGLGEAFPGINPGASIGAAWIQAPDVSAQSVLAAADAAMYAAKQAGKGRVIVRESRGPAPRALFA